MVRFQQTLLLVAITNSRTDFVPKNMYGLPRKCKVELNAATMLFCVNVSGLRVEPLAPGGLDGIRAHRF